jgi:hypothetical protein
MIASSVSVGYKGYPVPVLHYAWDKVKDPTDWKKPVVAVVSADILDVVVAAIEYFTVTVPTVFCVDDETCVVVSAGYRMGSAGGR